jgi:putative addiction module killer protein
VAARSEGHARRAKAFDRLDRPADGNPAKARGVGAEIVEFQIEFGPGYRVYYVQRGELWILLLLWWRQEHSGKGHPESQGIGKPAEKHGAR